MGRLICQHLQTFKVYISTIITRKSYKKMASFIATATKLEKAGTSRLDPRNEKKKGKKTIFTAFCYVVVVEAIARALPKWA